MEEKKQQTISRTRIFLSQPKKKQSQKIVHVSRFGHIVREIKEKDEKGLIC